MKIVIDLTSISYHLSGIERYAMCVTDKMIDIDRNNEYVLIFRNKVDSMFIDRIDDDRIKAIVLYGDNKLWFLQVTLLKALKQIKADKYLFFAFPSPIFFKRKGIINTIHDMGAWDSAEEAQTLNKYYFRISYGNAIRVSERIITVSDYSRNRISTILNVNKNRIVVINSAVYEGILDGETTNFSIVKDKYGIPEKYILSLSTLEPRKNIKLLFEAYDSISSFVNYDLVLVGRKGWKIDEVLNQYSSRERIHITGFVKDEHLPAIYKNAICFVFPSLYEGFGLPPVEALAFGIPVISSDAASLPEILMGQAVYFKSNSRKELEDLLKNLEANLDEMPHGMNEIQKKEYTFEMAATKVLTLVEFGRVDT